MSWVVYILECADGSLYTGVTNDLERRLKEHKSGKGAKYTRGRGPFQIVYKEKRKNRADACQRETEIKSLKRGQKIDLFELDHGFNEKFPTAIKPSPLKY